MADIEVDGRTRDPDSSGSVKQAASKTAEVAGSAASDVAGTAKEQAQTVVTEAKTQARSLASDVKDRVGTQARSQNDKLADGIRKFADELDEMVSERGDSPARSVVSQVSQGGRRVADYLAERGPEGVVSELQDFARRKPGTFLAVAAAAGFVAGRLGKSAFSVAKEESGGTSAPTTPAVGVAHVEEPYVVSEATYVAPTAPIAPGTPVAPSGYGNASTTAYGTSGALTDEYGSVRP